MVAGNGSGPTPDGENNGKVRGGYFDPQVKRLLWYLIASTRGGINRVRIIELINSHPSNANQIAQELRLDYKTVVHHLDMLSRNGLVVTDTKGVYGATYFLSPLMEKNYRSLTEMLAKFGKK